MEDCRMRDVEGRGTIEENEQIHICRRMCVAAVKYSALSHYAWRAVRGNLPFSFSTYRAYNSPCARASYTHLFLRYNEPGGRGGGGGLSSEAVSSTARRRREREGRGMRDE